MIINAFFLFRITKLGRCKVEKENVPGNMLSRWTNQLEAHTTPRNRELFSKISGTRREAILIRYLMMRWMML